jgi:SAM-dependent methyltransferase
MQFSHAFHAKSTLYARNGQPYDPTMSDLEAGTSRGPGNDLTPEEVTMRSGSFGDAADLYERYRPGPPVSAVDWLLPRRPATVVDLGAGTGALTKLLVDRADTVVAVEPDDRMRTVLAQNLPGVTALAGRGEAIPVADSSADAVLASSSWHWMEPITTLQEVARVLTPGGSLGAVWTGPDFEGPFLVQAQALLAQNPTESPSAIIDTHFQDSTLEIPAGSPFAQPEHRIDRWDIALTADELIGLLGTFSWIILMPDDQRERVIAEARRLLSDGLGIAGDVTVDVAYRADSWRTTLR